MINSLTILIGIFILLFIGFLFWYGVNIKPLTPSEVESYINKIRIVQNKQGQQDNAILTQIRNMAENDDGKYFYMVNLVKYRKQDASNPHDDPMAANSRYNKNVIPVLLKHGSHPVFSSSVKGSFLKEGIDVDWDSVSIVRYRSMRDFVKFATEVSTTGIDIDKWKAVDKTQVFPVKPVLSLIFARGTVAVILLVIASIIHIVLLMLHIY